MRTIRVEGSLFFQSKLHAPWGVILPDADEPKLHMVLYGECVIQSTSMDRPVRLRHGDVLLLPDGAEHWIADCVNSPRLPSEQFCRNLAAEQPRTERAEAPVQLLCGLIRFDRTLQHPMISQLPPYIHLAAESSEHAGWLPAIVSQFEAEFGQDSAYSDVIFDRLFEMMFIQTLRNHQALLASPQGFWAAIHDPKISRVLRLIHDSYADNLSIEVMAAEIFLSRSVFMQRFTSLVGISPNSYLTSWRMQKAISILRSDRKPIDFVAEQVGYASAESFGRAFKRHFDMTPHEARENR